MMKSHTRMDSPIGMLTLGLNAEPRRPHTEIRPWRAGDAVLAAAVQPYLSNHTLMRRFFSGTAGRLPEWYLRRLALGPRATWDAEVAAEPEMLVGWVEFGRLADEPTVADLSIVVADSWQRRGIGSALVRSFLPRCVQAGIRVVRADVLPSNHATRGLLTSLFPNGMTTSFREGTLHFEASLDSHVVTV